MILMIISFLLDNLIGIFLTSNSFFYPLFTLLALMLIYNDYKRDKRYYLIAFIFGLLYDSAYTNTIFLNAVVFSLLVILINFYFEKWGFDFLSVFVLGLILIVVYRVIIYLILLLIGYLSLDYIWLLKSIYQSVLINFLFIGINYKLKS